MQNFQRESGVNASRESKEQQSTLEKFFHLRVQKLRKESDSIRKEILALINQLCTFLQQNPDHKILILKLQQASSLISDKNSQNIISAIKQIEYSVNQQVLNQQQVIDQDQKEFQTIKEKLEDLKIGSQQVKTQIEQAHSDAFSKLQELQRKEKEFEGLNLEYETKMNEFFRTEEEKGSFEQVRLKCLAQNWSNKTELLKEIIGQRAQTRAQVSRVTIVIQKLKEKTLELEDLQQRYSHAKEENQKLFQQNLKLNDIVRNQQLRKQKLLDDLRRNVINKEIILAGQIAENWNLTEQKSRQLLFEIIKAINDKLSKTKLREVQEIIQYAENYLKNEGSSSQQKKIRSEELLEQ